MTTVLHSVYQLATRISFAISLFLLFSISLFGAPRISYLIPDLGTTRFATYVEFVGPSNVTNNFGTDGFYLNNPGDSIRVKCARPIDTMVVKIGPCVVSWNGRMISTHVFVVPTVQPNSDDWRQLSSPFRIPLVVEINGVASNADTFYVVKPFAFGDRRGDAGRIIGEGTLGRRSKRGAMIIDSAILAGNAQYRVSISDSDPNANGNQGYLPFVLLSPGNISGQNGTEIHADATDVNGGPGGGGGGGGYANYSPTGNDRGFNGGNGFTGGGPGGYNNANIPLTSPNSKRKPGIGSGEDLPENNSNTHGSASLNGVLGGEALTTFETAGGGTGHPFGQSGTGCNDRNTCDPIGGYGGGSGGRDAQRGGGGGFGEPGQSETGRQNGGRIHGNDCLVPLAGGSGGASGNPGPIGAISSSGGGGGGAVSIHAQLLSNFDVFAMGAASSSQTTRSGGGSGGGVIIGMRLDNSGPGFVTAQPVPSSPVGFLEGGRGRARYDARVGLSPAWFVGHLTDTMTNSLRDMSLSGYANGADLEVYVKPENGTWRVLTTVSGYPVGLSWRVNVRLPGIDTLYYIAVGQKIPLPTRSGFVFDPSVFLSQSAWNIVRIYGPPIIDAPRARNLGVYRCPGTIMRDTITVADSGQSPLIISSITWAGAPGFRVLSPASFPDTIKAYQSKQYIIEFTPQPGQTGVQIGQLQLHNNDTIAGHDPWLIDYTVDVRLVNLAYAWRGIPGDTVNIGVLCVGETFVDKITVRNEGVDSVTIEQLLSSDPSIVELTAALPVSRAPGTSVDFGVTFLAHRLGPAFVPLLVYVKGCPYPDTLYLLFEGVAPKITLIGTGQFGTVAVGSTRQVTLQIRNDGTSDLEINALPAVALPFRLISATPMPPVTLKTGELIDLVYEFAPTTPGQYQTTFHVSSIMNGRSCTDSVRIILAGIAAAVSVVPEPGSLTFAPTRSCDSLFDTVLVRNNGGVDVQLLYPAFINGPNAADFGIVTQPKADTTIPPGGFALYVVRFKPLQSATTLRTGILSVRTNASAVPQVDVPISGTSQSIALNGPRFIDFGLVTVGVPTMIPASYLNATGGQVDITQIRSSRPTVVTTAPASFTLANGGSQNVDVTVTASSEMSAIDTLWFVSAAPCPDSFPVLIRWTSESGSLGTQNTLPFGVLSNCETRIDSVAIFNTGRVPVDLIDVVITGPDRDLFTVLNPAAVTNVTLDTAQAVKLIVEFDPRGSTDGNKSAELVLRARINNQPTSFVTQLTGTRATTIPSTPNDVAFGEVDIQMTSSQTISILNTGTSPVHITSVTIRGSAGGVFTLAPITVPFTLQPGDRVDLRVNFRPEDNVFYEDSIIVAFDQPCADERAIALSGTGRLNVDISIILPEMIVDPTDDALEIPVKAKIVTGAADQAEVLLKATIRSQAGFYVAHSLTKGTITKNVVVGGMYELTVEVPDVVVTKNEETIFTILGQGTIGSADSTDLLLPDAQLLSGLVSPNIRKDEGWLKLEICTDGGPRLIKRAGQLRIDVLPNPADEHLDLSVSAYERGTHSVELLSTTGVVIETRTWEHHNGDPTRTFVFDTRALATGLYQLRLTSPTRQRVATAVIVH